MSEDKVSREEILHLLGPVKKSGGDILAFCPAHNDGSKHGHKGGHSLVLHASGVLKCWAGCSFADVMKALRERAGERPEYRPQQARPQTSGPGFELKVAYDYRDPFSGELVAVKGRFERPDPDGGKAEKSFRWRLPEGEYRDGLKAAGLSISEMPLWHGDDVVKNPDARVWVAEGESATEAIRARQEIAVCGAWGASQRDFGNAFEILRGRDVILWPDNDPAGREYMQHVLRALRPIAKSVAVVTPAVPPKGDAVEYFQAGGTVDDLLANVLVKPAVDVIAADYIRVRVPTEIGAVAFDFRDLNKMGGNFDCELTVTCLAPGFEPEPFTQRINLLSHSARASLETSLGKQFGKDANWTTAVSVAYARCRDAFLQTERAKPLSAIGSIEAPRFLIQDMLPEGSPTIIFGDGSVGKTFLCYSMALAVAFGGDWMNQPVTDFGGVLILDYETGEEMAKFRIRRLVEGMGLDPVIIDDLPIYVWDSGGVSLPDQVDAVKRFVDKYGIKLVIIDAGADACGGEPEKAYSALQYFNALKKINTTSITIAHVTNGDADFTSKRPFGSRFWHNRARRTWYIKRDTEEGSDTIDVAFMCRKVNDGSVPYPFSLQLAFDGDDGPVRLRRQAMRDLPVFASELPASEQVRDYLLKNGKAPVVEIAEAIGMGVREVETALKRGENDGRFVKVVVGKGRGNFTQWAVGGGA